MTGERLITLSRSVIPSADLHPTLFRKFVEQTGKVDGIGAYKVGARVGNGITLVEASRIVHNDSNAKIIYDHQKAGTDIPDEGENFADMCAEGNVDAAIIFPHSGPKTQEAYTKALMARGITVIVGGHMTHEAYIEPEGYITSEAPRRIYGLAAQMGVRNFVVPGNQPELVREYRQFITDVLGDEEFDLYAPGLIAQGGKISDLAKEAGKHWHGIVGRAICKAADFKQAAIETTSQLR